MLQTQDYIYYIVFDVWYLLVNKVIVMEIFAMICILISLGCSLVVLYDLETHPQQMKIMNAVWVITPLWSSVIGLYLYFALGRKGTKCAVRAAKAESKQPESSQMKDMLKEDMKMEETKGMDMHHTPMLKPWQSVIVGAFHCGAGCTLADLLGEFFLTIVPVAIFGSFLFGNWLLTYLLALSFGVYFQYRAIKEMSPMESRGAILKRAIKADFFSLSAWQVGMYGFMLPFLLGYFDNVSMSGFSWSFWLVMQGAMMCGFIVAYPVNALLIRMGIKKAM